MEELISGLRAAGEPTRLRLLNLLSKTELSVSDLTQILGQSQPRVSRHLKLLTEAGLISRFREGAWVFYKLVRPPKVLSKGDPDHTSKEYLPSMLAAALVDLVPQNDITVLRDLDRLEAVKQKRAAEAAAYFARNAEEWSRIRSLYIPEADVEAAMAEMLGGARVDQFLDIGTGTGRILEVFADRYEEGIGIDLSHEMLGVARSNLERAGLTNAYVRFADLYALPFESDSTDLVTVHHVLHFLEEPASALAEAVRVLKPGGRLLIADFAPHDVEFLRDEHAHRRLGFEEDEISSWLEEFGLEAIETQHLVADKTASAPGEKLTVTLWLGHQKKQAKAGQSLEQTS